MKKIKKQQLLLYMSVFDCVPSRCHIFYLDKALKPIQNVSALRLNIN